MRHRNRLRKLEDSHGDGIHVGMLECREGHEQTICGTTHAPVQGVTLARSEYPTDGAFWAAVEARTDMLGVFPVWISPEHNDI